MGEFIGDDVTLTLTPAQVAEVLGDPTPTMVAHAVITGGMIPAAAARTEAPKILSPLETPPIFVVGHARAGKSTFARLLAEHLWPQVSAAAREEVLVRETSSIIDEAAAEFLCELGLQTPCAGNKAAWQRYLHENGVRFRQGRIALGNRLCAAEPTYLIRGCVCAGARIVVGVRRSLELDGWEESLRAPALRVVVAVERPGAEVEDNYEPELSERADWRVRNAGGLGGLSEEARRVAAGIRALWCS